MKKLTTFLSFAAVAAMVAGVSGCGGTAGTSGTASSAAPPAAAATTASATAAAVADATAAAAASATVDTSTPETFTVFINDTSGVNWDNPVAQAITAKTGVALKFDIDSTDPDQKISLMCASGQYDDIINIPNLTPDMKALVDANALIKLDDLIEQYGPNIKAFYGDAFDQLRYSPDDPSIYGFGTSGAVGATVPGFEWNGGIWMQSGLLKQLGYPQIKTPDDFENAVKQALALQPTASDGSSMIGITLPTSDGFRFQFSIMFPILGMWGVTNAGDWYLDQSTMKMTYLETEPWFKEGMQFYNKLYNDGVLDPESFTQDYNTYQSKIAQGRVVGLMDQYWEFNSSDISLRSNNPDASYMGLNVMASDALNDKWYLKQSGNLANVGGFAITTACKDPAKFTNFLNWITSEEGQIMIEWGIEGTNYTIDSSGNRVRNPADVATDSKDGIAFLDSTGVKLYRWLEYPAGWKTSNGQVLNSDSLQDITLQFSQPQKDALAAYGYKYFTDIYPQPIDLPIRPYGDPSSVPTGLTDATSVAQQKITDMRVSSISHRRSWLSRISLIRSGASICPTLTPPASTLSRRKSTIAFNNA